MWWSKLGSHSEENNHLMNGFHQDLHADSDFSPYCYNEDGSWNEKVTKGALVISSAYKEGSRATVGYKDKTLDPSPDRHQLILGYDDYPDDPVWNYVTAHELGHVMGLEHEHQNTTRDYDVHFQCSGLADYDRVKIEIDSHPDWGFTIEDVCESYWLGTTHGLDWTAPGEYTTHMGWGGDYEYKQFGSFKYDHSSIMQYPSQTAWAADSKCDVTTCPWVKWKLEFPGWNVKPTEENAELIPQAIEVSDTDALAIREIYPWLPA